jgi:hypothetical protein
MNEVYSQEQVIGMLRAIRNLRYAQGVQQGYTDGRLSWGCFFSVDERSIKSKLVKKALEDTILTIPEEIKKGIGIGSSKT